MTRAKKTPKRSTTRTPDPSPTAEPIHTPLTLDDRDALDLLRHRIRWQAILIQHTLATWDEEENMLEDRDRTTLETGLIELCASIVRDTDAVRELCDVAEKRGGGQ